VGSPTPHPVGGTLHAPQTPLAERMKTFCEVGFFRCRQPSPSSPLKSGFSGQALRFGWLSLRSITGGRDTFTMEHSHYEQVPGHLAEGIIASHKKVAVAEEG